MISNKCYYALRATLELAKHEGEGPVTIGDIAQAQSMPVRFLESILRQLKQGGFTDSVRGKEGGYSLARPAKEICVGEIVRLIEGPIVSVNPLAQSDGTARNDVFDEVWEKSEASLSSFLDGITFDELARKDKEQQQSHVANYMI